MLDLICCKTAKKESQAYQPGIPITLNLSADAALHIALNEPRRLTSSPPEAIGADERSQSFLESTFISSDFIARSSSWRIPRLRDSAQGQQMVCFCAGMARVLHR
jgi:hypothetical protein